VINFHYQLVYIVKTKEYFNEILYKSENKKQLKILVVKLLSVLTNNYTESEFYIEEKDDNILKTIYEYTDSLLSNINEKSTIVDKSLEYIWVNLIIDIIKEKQFENSENNIIVQLFKEIGLNQRVFKNIMEKLDKNIIEELKITKPNDLYEDMKLNFYIFCCENIFQDSYFIYNVPFLLETRAFLIKMSRNFNVELNKKLFYVLIKILDSEYYIRKIFQIPAELNINIYDYEDILKFKIIRNVNNTKDVSKLNKLIDNYKPIEKPLKDNKTKKLHKSSKQFINDYLLANKNQEIVKSLYGDKTYYYLKENFGKVEIKPKTAQATNTVEENCEKKGVIDNGQNDNTEDNKTKITTTNNGNNNYEEIEKISDEEEKNLDEMNEYNKSPENITQEKVDDEEQFVVVTNKLSGSDINPRVKRKKEKYHVQKGKKVEFYGKSLKKSTKNIETEEQIINMTEVKNKKENKDSTRLIISSENNLAFYDIDFEANIHRKTRIQTNETQFSVCLEIKKDSYIMGGRLGVYLFSNLVDSNSFNRKKLLDLAVLGGINISKNVIALTSNSIFSSGQDKLIFFNTSTKKLSKVIKDYSFSIYPDGIELMELANHNKILVCACQKYTSKQKNGILLINPNLEENQDIIHPFYETDNYEIHCFQQIYYKKDDKYVLSQYFFVGGFDQDKRVGILKLYRFINGPKTCNTEIEYIMDISLKESCLDKLKYSSSKKFNNKIEQKFEDVIPSNNNLSQNQILSCGGSDNNFNYDDFDTSIHTIAQSSTDGEIVMSTCDGNIYLLSEPNLSYFLNEEEN
jgi:hypothetical protein